jgi:altronate dehydratase large subunit
VVDRIAESGKRVERIVIQELGGFTPSLEAGVKLASKMVSEASIQSRKEADLSNLVVGLKCGASDATSGLASNPAVGVCTDLLVEGGATVIAAETTEMMGAEHILARRAVNSEVAERILAAVEEMESRAKSVGVDMRGSQPTPGNIAGGITTIEEKSLGAICKAGTSSIRNFLDYAEPPRERGLHLMDTPGSEMHVLPGLVAAGAQLILFTTGRGAPQGFPTVPVVKICGNRNTCERMREHIDVDVSAILEGEESIRGAGHGVFDRLLDVASGKLTRAELTGYIETLEIYTRGPVI